MLKNFNSHELRNYLGQDLLLLICSILVMAIAEIGTQNVLFKLHKIRNYRHDRMAMLHHMNMPGQNIILNALI